VKKGVPIEVTIRRRRDEGKRQDAALYPLALYPPRRGTVPSAALYPPQAFAGKTKQTTGEKLREVPRPGLTLFPDNPQRR
jgi:hypothetical protein